MSFNVFSFFLFLITFFPSPALRAAHYLVFYGCGILLACSGIVWGFMASSGTVKMPNWISAINVFLFFVMFGALFLGETESKFRLRAAVVGFTILLIMILVYVLY